jgi:hypothetical protein
MVLKSLPQFQPVVGFDVDHIDLASGEYRTFPAAQHNELVKILEDCIQPHLQNFKQEEQQSRLDRFFKTAVRAIASYEYQRGQQARFDRAAAKELVLFKQAINNVMILHVTLQTRWPMRGFWQQEKFLLRSHRPDHEKHRHLRCCWLRLTEAFCQPIFGPKMTSGITQSHR